MASKSISWASTQYGRNTSSSGFSSLSYLTIETWVKIPDLSAARAPVNIYDGSTRVLLFQVLTSGRLLVIYRGNSGEVRYDSANGFISTSSDWQYIGMTLAFGSGGSGGSCSFWKGTESTAPTETNIALLSGTPDGFNFSGTLTVGARDDDVAYIANLQDEVRIFNDIRTTTEIQDNYDIEITPDSSCIGYWKFNDDLTDSSSQGNNLTLNTGTATYSTDTPVSGGTPPATAVKDIISMGFIPFSR